MYRTLTQREATFQIKVVTIVSELATAAQALAPAAQAEENI